MFNSMQHQSTIAECSPALPESIATDVIVHDSKRDRASWPQRFWQYLAHQFMRGHEPRIWQQYNAFSQPIWRVYDSQTKQSVYCQSEAEVVDWLEQQMRC